MTDAKIRLLLVDDQLIIRQGLRSLLEAKPDLEVIGEAENGQQAIAQVETLQPDVVLMDVRMPIVDGVAATRVICQQFSQTKVLVLTTFDDDEYVSQAMRLGARGYLLKDTHSDDLAAAIRAVHKGYTQMGPGLLEKAIRLTARCAIAHPLTVELLSTPAIQTIPVSFGKKHGEIYLAMLTAKDEINSIHQSGCGCATCQKGFEQLQGRFPQPNFRF